MRIRTMIRLGVNTHNPNLSTTKKNETEWPSLFIQNSSYPAPLFVVLARENKIGQKKFLPCSSVCCPSQSHPDLAVQQHFELKMKNV